LHRGPEPLLFRARRGSRAPPRLPPHARRRPPDRGPPAGCGRERERHTRRSPPRRRRPPRPRRRSATRRPRVRRRKPLRRPHARAAPPRPRPARGPAPHAHRPGGGPVISRVVPVIAVVVVVTDAALLATGVIGPAVALALILPLVLPVRAIAVTDYVRRYRAHARASGSRRGALRGLAADDPSLRMFVAEARTFASLGRWVARRPDVPDGAVAIGYSRGTLGVPVALVIAALIELVAVHLLIPWPIVRLVLDLLGIYGLLM